MIERIKRMFPDALIVEGYDNAILGIDDGASRVIYSVTKFVELMEEKDGMEFDEAMEFFDFNTRCAYVGEYTPIWCDDTF